MKYQRRFLKILENGPNYSPAAPNTSGSGGAFGNGPSIGVAGSATGTPGTDSYAPGDYRMPTFLGAKKPKKRKKKK